MNEGLIPRRYAKALFKVALEKKVEPRLYELMTTLANSFRQLPELSEVVKNPFQSVDDKLKLLTTAAGATGADVVFNDFLHLMVQNNRLGLVELTARAYCAIYREANNIHVVHLTTAAKLDKAASDRLKALIEKHLGGAAMEFSSSVDPSLIGGFAVTVDNERLDASVGKQFNELRLNLLSKQHQ